MKFRYSGYELVLGIILVLALLPASTANASINSTGYWVWDENLGLNTTYFWDAKSFSGFYHDINLRNSSEQLEIRNIDRNLGIGDIIYTAKPIETGFEYDEWGSYQVIGFIGSEYFAGYPKDTVYGKIDDVSLLSDNVLSKVLTDSNDKVSMYSGSTLVLEEGYYLNIPEVDVNGGTIRVQIEKDGDVLDDQFISSGDDYIYEITIGGAEDVPIIIVHFGTVFTGVETSAVFVEGIFQISASHVELNRRDSFGQMRVTSIGSDGIKMNNYNSISLEKGAVVEIMGGIKLKVADNDTLRFAPVHRIYGLGTYEQRGTIYDVNEDDSIATWTPFNFEGFYYDFDEDVGTEQLSIENIDGRIIPENKLVYSSGIYPLGFKHEEWGSFPIIGVFGEGFVPLLNRGDDIHLAKPYRLSRLLIDDDDVYTLKPGEILDLGEGYALEARKIDVEGSKAWLEFTRDDKFVDGRIIYMGEDGGDWILDLKDIGTEGDAIVLRVHVERVYQGEVDPVVQIEGIWLTDYENAFTIEPGDEYGELCITDIGEGAAGKNPEFGYLQLRNLNPIIMDINSVKHIAESMSLRVTNIDALRFYPFIEKTPVEKTYPQTATIGLYTGNIKEGDGFQINNYVIDVTNVFLENGSVAYYVYEEDRLVDDGLLKAGETLEFDFEEDGKVTMKLLSARAGYQLPNTWVELKLNNYRISNLHTDGIVDGGHEFAKFHETYLIPLQKGWNSVSFNATPDNPDIRSIFSDDEYVILPVYAWNATGKQYHTANIIGTENEYRILALKDTEVTFAGIPCSEQRV